VLVWVFSAGRFAAPPANASTQTDRKTNDANRRRSPCCSAGIEVGLRPYSSKPAYRFANCSSACSCSARSYCSSRRYRSSARCIGVHLEAWAIHVGDAYPLHSSRHLYGRRCIRLDSVSGPSLIRHCDSSVVGGCYHQFLSCYAQNLPGRLPPPPTSVVRISECEACRRRVPRANGD
jgi:hypothetical protein